MVRNLFPLASTYLKLSNFDFAPKRLALLLSSHPDLYSINNFTDAFDQLQLPNAAIEITLEHLPSLHFPVLSMMQMNNRPEFVILTKIEKDVVHIIDENLNHRTFIQTDFQTAWQQVAIITDVHERKKRTFDFLQTITSIPVIIIAAILLTAASAANWPLFFYNLLSLAGLYISINIFLTENGQSSFLNRFCSGGDHVSCLSVLKSSGARFLGIIKLSDASLLYFATLFITGLFAQHDFIPLATIASTAALLIIPYSIFYQARILKKWCPLCLGIVSVLILQGTLVFATGAGFDYPSLKAIIYMVTAALLVISLGLLIKQQYHTAQSASRFEEEALSFKRNYELFLAGYDKMPVLPVANFQSPVAYGDPDAPIQLIVVSNPLCQPCSETHGIISQMMRQLPGQLYVQYVFHCNAADEHDQRTVVARRLITLCRELPQQQRHELLDHWYEHHKIAAVNANKESSSANNSEYAANIINLFHQFRTRLHIHISPVIILNGKQLPPGYYPDCLPWVLPYCADRLPAVNTTNSTFFLQEKQLQW